LGNELCNVLYSDQDRLSFTSIKGVGYNKLGTAARKIESDRPSLQLRCQTLRICYSLTTKATKDANNYSIAILNSAQYKLSISHLNTYFTTIYNKNHPLNAYFFQNTLNQSCQYFFIYKGNMPFFPFFYSKVDTLS
jgi:hypothetical protein